MNVRFVTHAPTGDRRHFVGEDDVRVVLGRLPGETWSRVRTVVFNDHSRGARVLGYVSTRGRRDVALCAFPRNVRRLGRPAHVFGAIAGYPWPMVALRRYWLYGTLLHEIGHLQVVDADASSPRRRFADETRAEELAEEWRATLWARPFESRDPCHGAPSEAELRLLESGWRGALEEYERARARSAERDWAGAYAHLERALAHHPDHEGALDDLATAYLLGRGVDRSPARAAELFERCARISPVDPGVRIGLAVALAEIGRVDEAIEDFVRAEPRISWPVGKRRFARAIADAGRSDVAVRILRRVVRENPNDRRSAECLSAILARRQSPTPE